MERAAKGITAAITASWSTDTQVMVFAGPGNNGGDALAVARMLAEKGYVTRVYLFNIGSNLSADCATNKKRLEDCKKVKEFIEVTNEFDPPRLEKGMLVIDGLFGSGLNKPLAGGFASLVKYINQSPAQIASIDIPSGLMSEDNTYSVRANIIRADMTLTIQHKKLSFMFSENQQFVGKLKIIDIGLSKEGADKIPAGYSIIEKDDITPHILHRDRFAHKGNMGHALLIAGSYGMAGAAVLAAKACLRSGAGKVTVGTPKKNNDILQIAVPEAIIHHDKDDKYFTEPLDVEEFDAIGIGPGMGQNENSAIALITQIRKSQVPIVLDADALNILASHRAWLQQLPKGMIMTPHPKEFERMAGNHYTDSYERLCKAQAMARQMQAYIILKGHYSALCLPDGNVNFNSTGNAGMATAGSGDVLTGIITGLLARGYKQAEACITGMYLHGLAGDLAAEEYGKESMTASDIIKYIPRAFTILDK